MLGGLTHLVKHIAPPGAEVVPDSQGSHRARCVKCIGGAWVAASYFEIVIGIPTFSTRPMVVWNKMLRIRKVVRSHTVSFTE
jgi:hypothetical protein